jgi:hypothetical protein
MISYAERGLTAISLVSLEKLLAALGGSLSDFFSEKEPPGEGPFHSREQMRVVSDMDRTYTILFGRRPDVRLEMSDERIRPSGERPKFARLNADIAGYVLSGSLILELRGEEPRRLRPGDAFYVTRNTAHRGYAAEGEEVRLITASPLAT